MRVIRLSVALTLLFSLSSFPLFAAPSPTDSAVANDGTLYLLRHAQYAELFPEGSEYAKDAWILALEIRRPENQPELLLLPSDAVGPEAPRALVHDDVSDSTFVLWEGYHSNIYPQLKLTSYDGNSWSPPLDVPGNLFAFKGAPQLAVTRSASSTTDSIVLHIVWWEEAFGISRKNYAPILVGRHSGEAPPEVLHLGDLAQWVHDDGARADVPAGVEDLLSMEVQASEKATVISFVSSNTGKLETVQIEALPGELQAFADEARAQITGMSNRVTSSAELAQGVRQALESGSWNLHDGSLTYILGRLEDLIANSPFPSNSEELVGLSSQMRTQVIGMSARIETGGVESMEPSRVIELRSDSNETHSFRVSLLASRALPQVGPDPTLFHSSDGREVLLAWQSGDVMFWVESNGTEWGDVRQMDLDERFGAVELYQMLGQRMQRR